jgi:hypothetical protein
VTLKRFFAPEWVFIFGILFSFHSKSAPEAANNEPGSGRGLEIIRFVASGLYAAGLPDVKKFR